ncbi:hypothetical protein [Maritimibacter sp. UBA3975]|mgnify:CR=1 FL=1|uniref:hypothetical protein n=1 Tax=Maritimibacter sp. UBA3975 TaxID=1946833 RepID=UPI000C0BB861|nr:hypothetical protein [Maritimibacter sp. UBA3975]MAM61664.1 hypothetical protein [Maritimibacter sp.]
MKQISDRVSRLGRWLARRGTNEPAKTVIYRPAGGVGLGHLLFSLAGYSSLARDIWAGFVSTGQSTEFDRDGTATGIFADHLTLVPDPGLPVTFGLPAIRDRLTPEALEGKRCALIGRKEARRRAQAEFPQLTDATFFEQEDDALSPDALRPFDVIYVDSVLPPTQLTGRIRSLRPLLVPNADTERRAIAVCPSEPFVGVHLRHGNGEHLHGRLEGGQAEFDDYLNLVADTAREVADTAGLGAILCISDNAETAERLAARSGGVALPPDDLPQTAWRDHIGEAGEAFNDRLTRMMVDIAALSRGTRIVAGHSWFSESAALWGDPRRMISLTPEGTRMTTGRQPVPPEKA